MYVLDPVGRWQELVEVVDVTDELLTEEALVLPPLPLLDEVDHDHGAAVPGQQLVEVLAGHLGEGVLGVDEGRRYSRLYCTVPGSL